MVTPGKPVYDVVGAGGCTVCCPVTELDRTDITVPSPMGLKRSHGGRSRGDPGGRACRADPRGQGFSGPLNYNIRWKRGTVQ